MDLYKKIGLGTVQFGMDYGISNSKGKTPLNEVKEIFKYAEKNGISYLDTAEAYGESEELLGLNDLTKFRVISKFLCKDGSSVIREGLYQSLRKLKVDSLYAYMAHRPKVLAANPKQWDDLMHLKNNGLVRKIGYSLNEPDELATLLDLNMVPDIVQVPYNFLDRRFKENLIMLKELGCETHSRSCFLQGLFFMERNSLGTHFDEVKQIIAELQDTHGDNLSAALLMFVLELDYIDVVIMGVENLAQLKQNVDNITKAKKITRTQPIIEDRILIPSLWPKA